MNTTVQVQTPSVSVINGQAKTTSLDVAEFFGKRHTHILEKIQKLDCSSEFTSANFSAHVENIKAGAVCRESKYYEMTKDGFMFLVMGFTGAKAAQFKEAYIKRFNEMEKALHNPLALTNGQHFVVAKDGVVIFHKVLSDRTAKGYLQHKPTQECEQALGLMKSLQDVAKLSGDISYGQVRDGVRQLLIHLGQYQPYEQVRPAIIVLEATERMLCRLWTMIDESSFRASLLQNLAKSGRPMTDGNMDTLGHINSILSRKMMTVQLPTYQ